VVVLAASKAGAGPSMHPSVGLASASIRCGKSLLSDFCFFFVFLSLLSICHSKSFFCNQLFLHDLFKKHIKIQKKL